MRTYQMRSAIASTISGVNEDEKTSARNSAVHFPLRRAKRDAGNDPERGEDPPSQPRGWSHLDACGIVRRHRVGSTQREMDGAVLALVFLILVTPEIVDAIALLIWYVRSGVVRPEHEDPRGQLRDGPSVGEAFACSQRPSSR